MPKDVYTGVLLCQLAVANGTNVANVDLVRLGLKNKFKLKQLINLGAVMKGRDCKDYCT